MIATQKTKYPPTRSIFVDVDGTLYTNGALNNLVVEFCVERKAAGFILVLWSARGKQYAQDVAEQFGVSHIFDDIVSKPGYILDDKGWGWIQYTHVIRPFSEPIQGVELNEGDAA